MLISGLSAHGDHVPRATLTKIIKKGDAGFELLVHTYKTIQKPSIQRWVIEGIGYFYKKPEARKLLIAALAHEKMTIRLHAMIALRKYGDPKDLKFLLPLLHDESGGIRYNAITFLKDSGIEGLQKEFKALEKDEKPYIRKLISKIKG